MGVVAVVSETLKIILRAPRILVSVLAFPEHGRLLARFIALHRPLARPGKSFVLNVCSLFGCLRRRELRRGRPVCRDNRQNNP